MNDREKILDRVQKLLALANDNANVNEAAAAAKQAQRLMHKYNLTALMVESFDSTVTKEEQINPDSIPLDVFNKNVPTWKSRLGMIVAKANHCRIWISHHQGKKGLGLVGRNSDAKVVRFLYHYLLKEVDRLTLVFGAGQGRTWANNFRLGALDTIEQRLNEALQESEEILKEECTKTGVALVHVSNAIEKFARKGEAVEKWMDMNMNLRKGATRTHTHHNGARQAGRRAAHQIDLNPSRKKLAS